MLAAEALATAARLAAVGGGDGDSNPVRVVERRRVGALFAAALPACGVVGSRFGVLLGLHCLLWGAGGWRYQALHQAGGGAGWLCLGSTLPEVGGWRQVVSTASGSGLGLGALLAAALADAGGGLGELSWATMPAAMPTGRQLGVL